MISFGIFGTYLDSLRLKMIINYIESQLLLVCFWFIASCNKELAIHHNGSGHVATSVHLRHL